MCRRKQTLPEAHDGPGAKPNCITADAYSGVALLEHGVSPEMRTHGAPGPREKQSELGVQSMGSICAHGRFQTMVVCRARGNRRTLPPPATRGWELVPTMVMTHV